MAETTTSTEAPASIVSLTESAAGEVKRLLAEEPDKEGLRLEIRGGGCSGMQYGFAFDEEVAEDDTTVVRDVVMETTAGARAASVQVLLDPISLQYLEGSQLDYVENAQGEQFVIRNPKAKGSCGCGSSFSTE